MRLSELSHRADGVVDDSILNDCDNLQFVRQQLDGLAEARSISLLPPADNARYLQLCEKERALLRRARQWAGRAEEGAECRQTGRFVALPARPLAEPSAGLD